MGRDMTPAEIYIEDKRMSAQNISLRTLKLINTIDGTPVVKSETEAKAKYPELHLLLDGFTNMYDRYQLDQNALSVFDEIEQHIVSLEHMLDKTHRIPIPNRHNIKTAYDTTVLWFNGQLDRDFYYNTENNNLFRNFIEKMISEKS